MKLLKNLLLLLPLAIFVAAPLVVIASPFETSALQLKADRDAADEKCQYRILGMPTWFRGLSKIDANGECGIISPDDLNTAGIGESSNGLQNFIWRIALNVIEIGLFIAGYVAIFFVIYGGFQFLTGGSNPGQIEKARTTILNAVIGLTISMAAIAAVNLIFGIING